MKKLSKILIGAATSVAVFTPATFALTSCGAVVTHMDHGTDIYLNTEEKT